VSSKVRIIAGQWRGRKIEFLDIASVRPTPDRVRETLFNWLAPSIDKSRCLDLFAGSGVLGFEALSRGAERVVMVDKNALVCSKLKEQAGLLGADNAYIIHHEAMQFLEAVEYFDDRLTPFDIVFLDPPFSSKLANKLMRMLSNEDGDREKPMLNDDAIVYLEVPNSKKLDTAKMFPGWNIVRSGKTAQVRYFLLQRTKISKSNGKMETAKLRS